MQPQSDNSQPPAPGWEYHPGQAAPAPAPEVAQAHPEPEHENAISWTASEFIAHKKNFGWYILLTLAGFLGAAIVLFITHDKISAVMVLVVAVVMGVIAGRKPRTLNYRLDESGIHIGQKSYKYAEFKVFSVIDEGALTSIDLIPFKRFMPSISIYYEPNDEERITKVLSSYLPFKEGQKDAVDRFMHKIRF